MPDGTSALTVTTLRVEREKLDLMKEIAEAELRSLNSKLRAMIDVEIARYQEERQAA